MKHEFGNEKKRKMKGNEKKKKLEMMTMLTLEERNFIINIIKTQHQ